MAGNGGVFLVCLLFTCNLIIAQVHPGFRVTGRHLYDRCGEKVILRGVANPNIWFEKNGIPRYAEIEKTGANVVRIVWQVNGSADDLDQAISNCREQHMIPMVELHDATGDWSKLQDCIDYWVRPDIVDVMLGHEEYLLINIANECGNSTVSNTSFRNGYEDAVNAMRNAGIHVPLVIDGTSWGQNINILQSEGPYLINADPDHNLIFSVHMWWPVMYGYTENDIVDEIAESVGMNLPLIVGEFSQMHGSCTDNTITESNSIAYKTVIRECQENEVGYIAWSWFGNCNDLWDMTANGTYATLYDWGQEVAVTDPNSISNTAARTYLMVNESCNPAGIGNTSVEQKSLGFRNYPNPFSINTSIVYRLLSPAHVKLTVFNSAGEVISVLEDSFQLPGEFSVTLPAKGLARGFYYYSIVAGEFHETRKMVYK